jgi:biopolymer transport protein ExbB
MKALNSIAAGSLFVLFLMLSFSLWAQDDAEAVADEAQAQAPVPVINPEKSRDELEQAYQKEYAFLEAQLRDLRERLEAFEQQSQSAESAKENQIESVEAEYIDLQSRGERLNDLVLEAERQIESVEDSSSTLEATFIQAGSTLEPYSDEFPRLAGIKSQEFLSSGDREKIDTLFAAAEGLITSLSSVRLVPGAFFLANGAEVNGTIVRIGNVAAYGVSDQGSGALAPAGEGRLKVWSTSTPDTAQALASGTNPPDLGIFLYESPTTAIEEKEGKTVLGVINSGGMIAWIIVFMGGIALMMILLRVVFLDRARLRTGKVVGAIGSLVSAGKLDEALASARELKGAASRVVSAAIRNLDRDREHIEDIISEQILHESSHLNRFGAAILVIAGVAPLLGLLGTVTGMISTFDIITEFGTGDPKLLSSGISVALVTTEVGLIVAIPALICGNLLSGWAESIKDDMEKAALHVINVYKGAPATEPAIEQT